MVAPLKNPHSVEKTGFNLANDGFVYRNQLYLFENVIETTVARASLEYKVVLVGSTFTHSISIILGMKSGEQLQVTEQPTWTSTTKQNTIEHVERLFDLISQKSWANRVSKYTKQVEQVGFFEYQGWRFYPQRQQMQDVGNNKYYDVAATKFLRYHGFMALRNKNEGIASRLLGKVTGDRVGFRTFTDTDALMALLKHYFNLGW